MITPEEIRTRASRLFEPAVSAWVAGDASFFPLRLRGANLRVTSSTTQSELIEQVERLRAGSKSTRGYGYSIRYDQVRKRQHGLNNYPSAIEFETLDDLIRLIGKQVDFRQIQRSVELVRSRLPQLDTWLLRGWKKLVPVVDVAGDLLTVTEYMLQHPRPDCYMRELPLAVSSKLIEAHKGLLSEWWDQLLPETAIDFGAVKHFERRYGFRYPRKHLLLRILDDRLLTELGLPCSELSLPTEELDRLPVNACQVIVVENKINLLTLPPLPRTLALGAMGNNLSEYQRIGWFRTNPLLYWGDIDEDGLLILSRARFAFPHLQSCMMDADTLHEFRDLVGPGLAAASREEPEQLLAGELSALRQCRAEHLRLEQERIPQAHVDRLLPNVARWSPTESKTM